MVYQKTSKRALPLLLSVSSYDAQGRFLGYETGTGAERRLFKYTYNSAGLRDTFTDPLSRVLHYTYDAASRMTSLERGDGSVVQFGYDAAGQLASLTPPGRSAHLFTYSSDGQLTSYTPPDIGAGETTTTYTFNKDRKPLGITRPNGVNIAFAYDSAGRLGSRTAGPNTTTFTYNPTTGLLASIDSPGENELAFAHDGPFQTGLSWSGLVEGSVAHALDNHLREGSQTVNGGNSVSFVYDADGLLVQAGELVITRDQPAGAVTATILGNVTDRFTYNNFGELSGYTAEVNGTSVYSIHLTRDQLARVTRKVETLAGQSLTFNYTYDAADQLTAAEGPGGATQYTYDSNGNRVSLTKQAGVIPASYDGLDRLLQFGSATFTYDANGSVIQRSENGSAAMFNYDEMGNLTQVSTPDGTKIDYVVDGEGRRIGKKRNGTFIRGFLYQDLLDPVAELDANNQIISRFVYATRSKVPDYMVRGGVAYRIISDHLDSPRLVINSVTGEIIQRIEYDEFGNILQDTNPGFQPFGFTGGIYDPETGLTHLGAREYDPRIGRWLTKDPILFRGRSTNLYTYASNDPVNFVDPLGFAKITVNFYDGMNLWGMGLGHSSITIDGKTYDPYWAEGEQENPPVAPFERIDLKISDEAFRNIQDYLKNYERKDYNKRHPYNPSDHNCGDFVRDVLRKGGINPPQFTPSPWELDLWLYEYAQAQKQGFAK